MKFELTILGCNSAIPAFNRFPTSQVLQVDNQLYLIDCGEGSQIRIGELAIKKSKINQIFISHLHGDHVFGLIGLLTSMSLAGRKKQIQIFSPPGLREMIEVQIKHSQSHLSYPIEFSELDTTMSALIFEDKAVEVHSIPLVHRIPTTGFLFREKPGLLNIKSEKVKSLNISIEQIIDIKNGSDFTTETGQHIPNHELVLSRMKQRAYAYCSDTMYTESIIPIIKGVDLLYHETTFLHEKLEQAKVTKHSTALQAANIAKAAGVGQLIIGHYSSRYDDVSALVKEAQSVFPNTVAGLDRQRYEVPQVREKA